MKNVFAVAAVLVVTASLSACGGGSSGAAPEAAPTPEENKTHTILYEVTSDGATSPSVIVSGKMGGDKEQLIDVALPFTQEFTDKNETEYESFYSVSASKDDSAASITCRITIDGEVMDEQTSTGIESPYCSAFPDL